MYKRKLLVVATAVAAVLVSATAVSATGNHNGNNGGYKPCYEDDKEIVLPLEKNDQSPQSEYKGEGEEYSRRHKKPYHRKCHDKPKVCEYNPQLPKWSKDCVKPEEPTTPEEPETPTVPVPEQPVVPSVTPAASTTQTVETPQPVFEDFQGK